MNEFPNIMTGRQAAEYLQLSYDVLRKKAAAGEIPGAKIGGTWRFSKRQLDEFIERGGSLASPSASPADAPEGSSP